MIASGDIESLDIFLEVYQKIVLLVCHIMSIATGSDTIKASVLTGLATRLQAFQNKDLQELTNATDIDLVLPR